MIGNALLVMASFAVGWVALWPARRALGAWLYPLAALPMGLLGWTMAAGVAGLLGRRLSWPLAAGAVIVFAALVFWALTSWIGSGRQDGAAPPVWTYAATWVGVVAATAAAVLSKMTIVSYDSWAHYQLAAIYLSDHGRPDPVALGATGPLIPAVIATARAFGANWMYALYPLMAANVLLLVAFATYQLAAPRVGRVTAGAISVVTGLALASVRWFVIDTFYVHSQMYSALLLSLAVMPIVLLAVREEREGASGTSAADDAAPSDSRALAVLFVAALATAAFALARPDGLVYAFIPILLVVTLRFRHRWASRRYMTFAIAYAVPVAAYYIPVFLRLGFWHSDKLTGKVALATLMAVALALVFGEVLARWKRTSWLFGGHRAMLVMLLIDAVAIVAAAVVFAKRFFPSLRNMVTNLLSTGGYGHLWYLIAGAILVTLLLGVLKCGDGPTFTLFAIAQFFAVALVVHGVAHPGRLATADSFNRVAFHMVPVAMWYIGSAVALFWPHRRAGVETE